MPAVTIELPGLLEPVTGGQRSVDVEAHTLGGALRALIEAIPALGVHIFDETGDLRQHVLCLHNGASSRWSKSLEVDVKDGDRITILQAVSGG